MRYDERERERETTTIIILLELVFQGSSRSSKVFKVFKVQLSQVAIPTRKEKTTNHTTNQSEDPGSRFIFEFLISFILLIVLQNFLYFHGNSLESVEILGFSATVAATVVARLVFTSLTYPIWQNDPYGIQQLSYFLT